MSMHLAFHATFIDIIISINAYDVHFIILGKLHYDVNKNKGCGGDRWRKVPHFSAAAASSGPKGRRSGSSRRGVGGVTSGQSPLLPLHVGKVYLTWRWAP